MQVQSKRCRDYNVIVLVKGRKVEIKSAKRIWVKPSANRSIMAQQTRQIFNHEVGRKKTDDEYADNEQGQG